jgi:hypothetical protein
MRGRRRFLRRGLKLLAGGTAGAALGGLATAAHAAEPVGDPADSQPSTPDLTDAWPPYPVPTAPTLDELGLPTIPYRKPPGPQSVVKSSPVITVYGRSFGVAPILGLLGDLNSFDELERSIEPWVQATSELAEAPVTVAPHLIYALARPCKGADDSCLIFLDGSGVDLVNEYILPAAERGMGVVLDAQMGRLSPSFFVRRMIDMGYMAYPNVHIALDPEFATQPDQNMPGHPIGWLSANAINEAQRILADYVRSEKLSHKKIMIVHQFVDELSDSWSMVYGKRNLEVFPEVDLVLDADGFGSPDAKIHKYNAITNPEAYPHLQWRGIKIFQHNKYAPRYSDTPVLTPRQIFGLDPTHAGWRMWAPPHLIVLA